MDYTTHENSHDEREGKTGMDLFTSNNEIEIKTKMNAHTKIPMGFLLCFDEKHTEEIYINPLQMEIKF